MKRLHMHLKTRGLETSIRFYDVLSGKAPDRKDANYTKWLLDEPAGNLSISTHPRSEGLDHVGISLDSRDALEKIAGRRRDEGKALFENNQTTGCYAKTNTIWAREPQGAVWELFHTSGHCKTYGETPDRELFGSRDGGDAPSHSA